MTHDILTKYMKKTQIYMPEKLLEEIKYYATKNGIPYSELIRQSVKEYLHKFKEEESFDWKAHAKIASTDMGGDLSSRVDEILYEQSK